MKALSPTSRLSQSDQHIYPKHKLTRSGYREPSGDGNVPRSHSAHPATAFLSVNLKPQQRSFSPEGQYHLCEQGANAERQGGVERGFVASNFAEMREIKQLSECESSTYICHPLP